MNLNIMTQAVGFHSLSWAALGLFTAIMIGIVIWIVKCDMTKKMCLATLLILMSPALAEEKVDMNKQKGIYSYSTTLETINLASDKAWTLAVDGAAPRPIKVPGGGWNSDQQTPQIPTMQVKDYVVYERKIAVPQVTKGQVTKILFGAVNYGAEVYIDGKLVITIEKPYVPFEADISNFVTPGQEHQLRVKAYHRRHYHDPNGEGKSSIVPVGFDFPAGARKWFSPWIWDGNTKLAYGITTSIQLAIYPPIYIKDIFIRPSVSKDSLSAEIWIHNSTDKKVNTSTVSKLSSWNNNQWKYPDIPGVTCVVGPGEIKKVLLGPIKWGLGEKSYWWPNIPFNEGYKATLHYLNIDLSIKDKVVHGHRQRFGFVEHGEGKYYYTVNGVRVNSIGDSISYGQVGEYDCWSTTPCFLPPNDKFKGCPETWKRYQRIGFNTIRLSTSVPTPYMMKTADEAGYMLIPEGGSWGNGTSIFDKKRFSRQLQEVIRACRNHPSVARYSMANESYHKGGPWNWLIDAALVVDSSRPYVFEVNPDRGFGKVSGMKSGYAYLMQHYDPIVKSGDFIRGMGECCWGTDEISPFAFAAREFKIKDWAYFAPWSWVNFWPNFLEGMSHERHPWKTNNAPNRQDGVNGWGSPLIKFLQKSLHPYLLIDHELQEKQQVEKSGCCTLTVNLLPKRELGDGSLPWPGYVPEYKKGIRIERKIEVFNGGLFGNQMRLRWSAHWDSPNGPIAIEGEISNPFVVEPGFHTTQTIPFIAPKPEKQKRKLYLVLESVKEGKTVFVEDAIYFIISRL